MNKETASAGELSKRGSQESDDGFGADERQVYAGGRASGLPLAGAGDRAAVEQRVQRLQHRRHLHAIKVRKIEHQKEQKAEYDALIAKRVAEKKEKVAAIKASHKKTA